MLPIKDWRLEFDERLPIYEQIIQRFHRSLINGELACAQRIPSIRELALLLKVNTNTVARAYQEMERGGLIFSKRGTGYFIVEDGSMKEQIKTETVLKALKGFLSEMRSLGFSDDDIIAELTAYMKGGASDGRSAH